MAIVLWALVVLALAACGTGAGSKRAVECRVDDDCDSSELGICETVSCESSSCQVTTLPDGKRCDDEDPVTGEDACVSGICAGVLKECDDDLGPCLRAVLDPKTDECVVEPVEDGKACDDNDACTAADSCQAGECQGSEPKACEAVDACHVAGVCDPETGKCQDMAAEDGTGCDDGLVCTSDDVCSQGECGGEPVVCDDGLVCSLDSCDETNGGCGSDMTSCTCFANQECDDGNACNGAETCDANSKLCQQGNPVVCGASGDPCLQNTCVPDTGLCEVEPAVDGSGCDDQSACTGRDTCQDGLCVGSDAVVCAALSQCHLAGACDSATGACSNPEKPKDTLCDDSNACTPSDSCQAGSCVGTGKVTCTPSDQCHDAGACNPATGGCSNPAKPNGVTCNDVNPCTNGDSCQNGACSPASQVVCAIQDSCHSAGTCNPQSGVCSNPVKGDGATCSDGETCTGPDTCTGGKCGGSAKVCNDMLACTVDSCSEALGGCVVDKSACSCTTSADCNDGNPCNGVETCNLQTLQCKSGTALDCSGLSDTCNVGSCNPTNGQCQASPKQNGTTCDDGNLCTSASSCQAGACMGSSPVTCAALDQCHDAGSCNPGTGKCSDPPKNNGSTCNDSNACTKTDSCQGGVCTGSDAVVCSALDQCHVAGVCDTSTGICSEPAKKNGSTCSDGSLCSQTDSCQGGLCVGGNPVTCGALDQCHLAGVCDVATGTCTDPLKKDGSGCSDGSSCTQTDSCQSGTCLGSSPIKCTPSDTCHVAGTCDAATGICSNPNKTNGSPCNDNSLCTQSDTCQTGVCTGASPVVCTASDQCHNAGTCDVGTGMCSDPAKPDKTPCNDGSACTGSDQCTTGACRGSSISCDDSIACSVDACDATAGCTHDLSQCGCTTDAKCDDGDACNGAEKCDLQTLTCVKGTQVSCTGLDDACNTGTCDRQTGTCKKAPKGDGTGCNDGSACTRSDGCVAGTCVGADPVVCAASDQCHAVGTCAPATGACSNPNKTDGSGCDDNNGCTKTDTCQGGTCTGTSPVVCTAIDQCHNAGVCVAKTGLCTTPVRAGSCDDNDECTQTDICQSGACTGNARDNMNADWADDPGARSVGPTSVDTFTDKAGNAVIVGTYHGTIAFDDKDDASYALLGLKQAVGIYWAVYRETGGIASVANIAGGSGSLTVEHATGHSDDSFTLLGTVQGSVTFGLDANGTTVDAKNNLVYVAHYKPDGNIAWVAQLEPSGQSAFTANSIAAFDDQSVIAIGAINGSMAFSDATGTVFGATEGLGVWAARLDENGNGQWAELVVHPEGSASAHSVTTHEDGGASLTGGFAGIAHLGPDGKLDIKVSDAEIRAGRDIWMQKLDKEGNLKWGGRAGGTGADIPGDVARSKDGGTLLLANVIGGAPNVELNGTQPLYASNSGLLQAHVISIQSDGTLVTDGLIGDSEKGHTRGFALELDASGYYAVAGTFGTTTSLYSQMGFGSGAPPNAADLTIGSLYQGPSTLFVARVDAGSFFDWAVQAGGDGSGMGVTPADGAISTWDIVATAHASHSVTVAGMFNTDAYFGDKVPEALQSADGSVGNPFVVHLNSEAEYDYCP